MYFSQSIQWAVVLFDASWQPSVYFGNAGEINLVVSANVFINYKIGNFH